MAGPPHDQESLLVRTPARPAPRFNGTAVALAILLVGGAVGAGLVYGLSGRQPGSSATSPQSDGEPVPPRELQQLATDYRQASAAGPPARLVPATMPVAARLAGTGRGEDPQARARREALLREADSAAHAGVLFGPSAGTTRLADSGSGPPGPGSQAAPSDDAIASGGRAASVPGSGIGVDGQMQGAGTGQNLQDEKRSFIDAAKGGDGVYLEKPYLRPASAFEVQAGSTIPAALLTALNSDLPGAVEAQVTENVYDSPSGRTLLIPQGAKLLGRYDSKVAYGQSRLLVVWSRLVMPNGRSIQLDGMVGADGTGASGLTDGIDYHTGQILRGILLSTAISLGGNLARGQGDATSVRGSVGETVSQEASGVGQAVTRRDLDIQPTLTVRPGWPLRVLVDRDILLQPYTP